MNASQDNPDSQCAGHGPNRNGPGKPVGRRGAQRGGTSQNLALAMVVVAGILFVIGIMITPSAKKQPIRPQPKPRSTESPFVASAPKAGKTQKPFATTEPMAGNTQKPLVPSDSKTGSAPKQPLPSSPPVKPPPAVPAPAPAPGPGASVREGQDKSSAFGRAAQAPGGRVEVRPVEPPREQRPVVLPPPQPPVVRPPVQAPPVSDQFTIDVYSRITRILDGSSFPVDDAILGQLADGDLKAQVVFNGSVLPKGKVTLEWQLDEISAGPKPALLNQVLQYNSEPTVGTYRLILRLDKTVVKTFTFRISPARRSPVNKERVP